MQIASLQSTWRTDQLNAISVDDFMEADDDASSNCLFGFTLHAKMQLVLLIML